MIIVKLRPAGFEYDIHSLIKAFYPAEDVKILTEAEEAMESSSHMPTVQVEIKEERLICRVNEDENSEVLLPKENRSSVKSKLKHLLYTMLSAYTGKTLPWGNLTGIRPTKIAYGLLEEGKTREEIISHMRTHYDASMEKAALSVDIALREREILSRIHWEEGYSLYVGIPFCPTTCLYCSFTSYPIGQWKKRVGDYLTALEKEMDYVAEAFRGRILDTVYIGGGTPTTLEPEELARLFSALQSRFTFSAVKEFTVEAGRADSITAGKLKVMKDYGVNRISVNPQTMKEETLKIIGRHHTVEQVKEAFYLARRAGIENINMDLILGLPGEGPEDVSATMEEIKKLAPDSLTVHSLAIKRASKMNQWIEENGTEGLQNTEANMEAAANAAREMGMKPYYLYRQKNM
ncbi:MAG: coproporphyrinogen dehydrogenase HemZ, partial [Lachnospiraceae bacterium]